MSDSLVIYEIPDDNMPGLMVKLDKLSRKSQRILGKPIELTVLEEVRTPKTKRLGSQLVPWLDAEGNQYVDISYKVTISAETPRIAGWTFIATIDHSATTGNLLRVSPNVVCEVPDKYRSIGPLCDHCGKIRSRRDTFLLRSDTTGELKQIGRQCIRDFIGYDVEAVVAMAEMVGYATPSSSDADYDGDVAGGMRDRRYILVKTYLAHVAAMLRAYGWVGRREAEIVYKMSTASAAHENMFRKRSPKFQPIALTDKDFATADAARAWAVNLAGRNDYEHNIRVLAGESMIENRSTGTLASMIPSYLRHIEKEFTRVQRKTALNLTDSRHVGTLGEKIGATKKHTIAPIDAVLYGFFATTGQFGPTYIYRFLTSDGNVLVWFASGSSAGAEKLDLGAIDAANRVKVRILAGTVKKHTAYEDVKQTVLTRCKIEKLSPPATDTEETC